MALVSLWTQLLQRQTHPSSSCCSLNPILTSFLSGLFRNPQLFPRTAEHGVGLRTGIQFRIRVVASDNKERTLEKRMPESRLGSILR